MSDHTHWPWLLRWPVVSVLVVVLGVVTFLVFIEEMAKHPKQMVRAFEEFVHGDC
jgi:hypothetical protein